MAFAYHAKKTAMALKTYINGKSIAYTCLWFALIQTFVREKKIVAGDISFVRFCHVFSNLLIGYGIERSEDLSVLYTFVVQQKRTNEIAL